MNYRQRILIGARDLFYNHGIKKITMDGIARHLSISKKTIYKEFNDKNEIVVEICKLDVKQHHKSLTLIQSKATNAIDAIVQIMNYVSKYLDSVNPSYFYDMNKYHPLAWNVFKQFKLSYVMNSVKEMLHRGQNEELFRTDFNIDIIAKLRIVEMDAVLNEEFFEPDEYVLSDIHRELLRHYIQGISTIKGHHLINEYFNTNKDTEFAIDSLSGIKN